MDGQVAGGNRKRKRKAAGDNEAEGDHKKDADKARDDAEGEDKKVEGDKAEGDLKQAAIPKRKGKDKDAAITWHNEWLTRNHDALAALPPGAQPTSPSHGELNYTVRVVLPKGTASIQVQLTNGVYYVYKAASGEKVGKPTVKWTQHEGPVNAWVVALRLARQ